MMNSLEVIDPGLASRQRQQEGWGGRARRDRLVREKSTGKLPPSFITGCSLEASRGLIFSSNVILCLQDKVTAHRGQRRVNRRACRRPASKRPTLSQLRTPTRTPLVSSALCLGGSWRQRTPRRSNRRIQVSDGTRRMPSTRLKV